MKALSGLDAGFLYLEAAGTPMHVGSVMQVQPARGRRDFHADLVAMLAERLPRTRVLRRVLEPAPFDLGHPRWREVDRVDLRKHVRKRRLPAPGTAAQLDALVARLHARALDRERPLWQFTVIEGLAGGGIALYAKIHHAVLDGQGGVALAQALLDIAPTPPRGKARPAARAAPATAPRATSAATALRANARQLWKALRAVPPTLKLARADAATWRDRFARLRDAVQLAPRTPFNAQCGEARAYARASLPLEDARRAAQGHGASLNDVVMALCATVLRDHLRRAGALPREALVAAMPVSLRAPGDAEVDNQVSMVQCPLATDVEDPVARLQAIAAATRGIKRSVAGARHLIPTDFPGLGAPKWATGLTRWWARSRLAERLPPLANVVVSNVPGPPVPLFVAGARVTHLHPVSIVTHGLGLNVTVQSYAGMLEFGITACRRALPRPQVLAQALAPALDELLAPLDA